MVGKLLSYIYERMDTIKQKLDSATAQIKAGKKALADALNFCHISAFPNNANPDKYETFDSYCAKIKLLKVDSN